MTILAENTPTKAYCNCLALEKGLDPAGYAGHFTDAIVFEVPLPWKQDLYTDEKVLPQGIRDLLALWLKRYHEGEPYNHRPLLIAPDNEYSQAGLRRVIFYARPKEPFAQFDKTEYLVPLDELGNLAWSLHEDRTALPRFEQYRVPNTENIRDILVCTHGTVDAACAKFGYPLYKHLRDTYANQDLRVWRVSHFGGHVFAPTLMEMPIGHYWAYVEKPQAAQIIQRDKDVESMRGHYRGWAGLDDGFIQTAERDLWQRYGWAWFTYHKTGKILAQDPDKEKPAWAEVQISFASPDGSIAGTAEVRIEVSHYIETISTTGYDHTYAYPQYQVTQLAVSEQVLAR